MLNRTDRRLASRDEKLMLRDRRGSDLDGVSKEREDITRARVIVCGRDVIKSGNQTLESFLYVNREDVTGFVPTNVYARVTITRVILLGSGICIPRCAKLAAPQLSREPVRAL